MANELTNDLKAQIFAQESGDPFLTLVTLTHETFTARLVNNSSDIVSRGFTFIAFPMKIRIPSDDGETVRDFSIELDNASLELITNFRAVTSQIGVKFEMILASMPDVVQITFEDLLIQTITYNKNRISCKVIMDNFLNVPMTSERYTPSLYPGMFG